MANNSSSVEEMKATGNNFGNVALLRSTLTHQAEQPTPEDRPMMGETSPCPVTSTNQTVKADGVEASQLSVTTPASKGLPLTCDQCQKTFGNWGKLTQHLRIHSGAKPFKCQDCGKEFRQQGHLSTHSRIHLGLKPYVCDICNKAFSQNGHLKTHMRRHTGERPYECKLCAKKFMQMVHLKQHLACHAETKPYNCNKCERGFTQAAHLRKHCQNHHSKGVSEVKDNLSKNQTMDDE